MAPAMSLSRATGRPATGLTSSRRRSTARRTVAAQATSDDRPNAALLTLSAGALLAQSAVVDPAAAAQLGAAPDQGVLTASHSTANYSNKFSSATAPAVLAEVADLNAGVRDTAKNYRDPAGSIQQDKFADKVKSGPSLGTKDLGDSVKSGLKDAKKKATKAFSALPTPAVGDLADLNGAVRGDSKSYRDPAGAVQQDNFADKVKSGPSLGSKDLGDSVKSGLNDIKKKATDAVSALPTPAVGDLAAGSGASKNYRDPAGAVQQDKFADKVKSGPSLGTKDLGDSVKSGLKDAKKKATNAFSALPTPAVGDLADLNADVRDLSKNYRDPIGSSQKASKLADKVKSGTPNLGSKDLGDSVKSGVKDIQKKATDAVSALPTPAVGDLAAGSGASKSYRDPAGAVQQDKFADKVNSGPSLGTKDLGDSVKSGLKDAKKKATNAFSAVPTPAVGDVADLNTGVTDQNKNYRDPAGAIQQDNFADKVKSGTPSLGSKDLGDSVKSGLNDIKKKATDAVSALPTPAVGDLAAGSGDSKNYRDPAGAVQQDKFADKVKSGPSLGTKDLGDSVKSGLKDAKKKATNAFSALPTPAVGDLADQSGGVRDSATNYRDSSVAVPQDKAQDALSGDNSAIGSGTQASSGLSAPDLGAAADAAKSQLDKASKLFSAVPTPAVGDLADLGSGVTDQNKNYRDPAGAIQQDKFADTVKSSPSLGSKDLGDSVKSGLNDIKKKATDAVSALPTPAVGDLAAGSGDSKNYRDPAGAVQQDKFADKVKSGPSFGTKGLGDSVKSGLKDAKRKATNAISDLPTPAVGDLADLNGDVRGDSKSYRDPAGAVQQDKFADKVKSGPSLGTKDLGDSVKSGLKDAQRKVTNAIN